MKKSNIDRFLELKGHIYGFGFNNETELMKFVKENKIKFEGEECGGIRFDKSKSGRRYITLIPTRAYIDAKP
ncbi:MAG: hypothetical protein ACQERX_06390 [Bacillota bacterium]